MKKMKHAAAIITAVLVAAAMMPLQTFAAAVPGMQTGEALEEESNKEYHTGLMPIQVRELSSEEAQALESGQIDAVGNGSYSSYNQYEVVADWDTYASRYYYNQLEQWEKDAYDRFEECAAYYLNTIEDARLYGRKGSSDSFYYANVDVSDLKISVSKREDLVDLYYMFLYSNPQYFYFMTSISYTYTGMAASPSSNIKDIYMIFYPDMADGDARRAAINDVDETVDELLSVARAEDGQLAQQKKLHDLVCARVVYDYESEKISGQSSSRWAKYEETHYTQTAYSVLRKSLPSDKTQYETVCAGYAQAYELLCNALDIDTVAVVSEGHEWNRVRLNGSWYEVDCTWDDNEDLPAGYCYDFFNCSASEVQREDIGPAKNMHRQELFLDDIMDPDICKKSMVVPATADSYGEIEQPAGTAVLPTISSYYEQNRQHYVALDVPAGVTCYYTTENDLITPVQSKCSKYTGQDIVCNPGEELFLLAVADGYLDSSLWKWEMEDSQNPEMHEVTFDANGGTASFSSKYVAADGTYGTLPITTRAKYRFDGWYTQKSGGTKIEAGTIASLTEPQTLYAHWTKVSVAKVKNVKLNNSTKRKLKVTYTKVSKADGYIVRYSLKSTMKKSSKVTVSKASATLKKLTSGKKYYVQVRAYMLDSTGAKITGAWSAKASKKAS